MNYLVKIPEEVWVAIIGGVVAIVVAKITHSGKTQSKEIVDKIDGVQKTADKNNEQIINISHKLELHDDAHLATMRLRLEKDLNAAVKKKETTQQEFEILSKMYTAYRAMGGNGIIDKLWEEYQKISFLKEN